MTKEVTIEILPESKFLMNMGGETYIGTELEITWLLASRYGATMQSMIDNINGKGVKITFEPIE